MNRSLLLVICDFLLLSLLALARFDEPESEAEPEAERAIAEDAAANQDLIDVLKMSLDAEQENREDLSAELETTREELDARAQALAERETKLAESRQTAEQLAAEKAELERQRESLAAAKAEAEAERAKLAEQTEAARAKLEAAEADRVALAKSLAEVKETAAASTERLRALQGELAEKASAVDELQAERERLASAVESTELEKRALATRLEVAQAEARVVAENLELARRDVEITRQEKASLQQTTTKLAEGVGSLAESTGALAESTDQIREEVKRAQPLSLNTIFDRYAKNRARVTFESEESALIGTTDETRVVDTVFVRQGQGVFALIPAGQTPFVVGGVRSVDGIIRVGSKAFRFNSVGALAADARVLVLGMPTSALEGTGVEPFDLAADPLKFPDAVLINGERNYFGQVGFKLVPGHPEYLDMDASIFNELFGEFAPRAGDFVFARTGELIGLMVNNGFAVTVPGITVTERLPLGDKFSAESVERYQRRMRANENALPAELR